MRDGTTILTDPTPLAQDPYVVDWIDGRLVRGAETRVYDKFTSSGYPMSHIVCARPQRLDLAGVWVIAPGQVIDQERAARRNAARHPTFTHLDRLARS